VLLSTDLAHLIVVGACEGNAPKITSHLFMNQAFCVIEAERSIEGMLDTVSETKPDVLVLEMDMVDAFRTETFNALEDMEPRLHRPLIVAVSDHQSQLDFARRQVLTRATVPLDLATSTVITPVVRGVLEGYTYHAPVGSHRVKLSALQMDVLRLMALGLDMPQLLLHTNRTIDTMYYLQRQIRIKLEADSNEQAILYALRDGVVAMLGHPKEKAG
jgi:DNA-binding NarL/FixJ family response regulator